MITNLHKPILVKEILSFINDKSDLSILDCTFGGGGHSQSFLNKGHHVAAIDQDKNAIKLAEKLSKKYDKFSFCKLNFREIEKIDKTNFPKKYSLILLDLGFSSNQLENKSIGLSFKINSKLNMNYLDEDITAFEIINHYNEESLSRIFKDYGEINNSKKLSEFIVKVRSKKLIETNFDLIEALRASGVNFRSKKIHFATQAFQALRIEANKEIDNLNNFLNKAHLFLEKSGFLAIISFHSLEDRVVKNYFKSNKVRKQKYFSNNQNWGFEILTKKPITPTKSEIIDNNRSRSAKLRVGRFIN